MRQKGVKLFMVFEDTFPDEYPSLQKYTRGVKRAERAIVGRDVEMDRVLAAMLRPELCNVILLAEAGSGKAHANGTMVPVADDRGYVPIEDLRPMDVVFGRNGDPTRVLQVFPQGKIPAYRVEFNDGSFVVCNDEHIWHVRTALERYRGKDYHDMTLRQMMDAQGRGRSSRFYVPVQGAVRRKERTDLIPGYLAGLLLSDLGSYDPSREAFVIAAADPDLCAKVEFLLKSGLIAYETVHVDDGMYFILPGLLSEKPDVRQTFIMQCGIPREYLLGSVDQRMDLLHALLDAGGVIGLPRLYDVMMEFRSEMLRRDVQTLGNSLGIRTQKLDDHISPRIVFLVPDRKKTELFTLPEIRGKMEGVLHSRSGKLTRYDNGLAVRSVMKLPEDMEMTCIYVDAPDHLYQVGYDHIVTHNTALVQGTMLKDPDRIYLEVDLSKMISDLSDANQMADRLKTLFDEVQGYSKQEHQEIVLFMDEFHQVVQLSDAAVEALKPLLADSGTRGIRVIAATTYEEFRKYISPNQPLVERLQRINLEAPGKDMVVEILRGMTQRYGVNNQFLNNSMFEAIYEYTNRYIPASAQPRKSILVLDSMVGWYRYKKRKMNMQLLADVIYESTGVNIAFRVDATKIESELNSRVFAQEFATHEIAKRLQVCVADLHDKTKPMSSFLFTGSTGTGKGCWDEEPVHVYRSDGSVIVKKHGDLEVGDYVFNRKGEPVLVTGVYHRGLKDVYRVTLGDDRSIIVDGSHLWSWKYAKGHESETFVTTSTEDLIRRGLYRGERNGRKSARIWIPMNEAVQYPEQKYEIHPYVIGALLGNGCLTVSPSLTLSSGNRFVPEKIAGLIGALGAKQYEKNYNWCFIEYQTKGLRGGLKNHLMSRDGVLQSVPELIGLKSHEKFIPERYKCGSIEQRWELIRGLFDTDGSISSCDGDRFNVSYSTTSKRLADDIRDVLFSLGISSTLNNHGDRNRDGDVHDEWHLHVKVPNERKYMFFSLPKKYDLAMKSKSVAKQRYKDYDILPIVSIEKLDEKLPTTCIMVEDDEHLYQTGQYIVTHNTEVTKQLARLLFEDERRLIRFDCSEYSKPDSLERFRVELTARVWERPYSIILLDEIEKACGEVTKLLLQVLDDARLMDANNREVSFTNAYIVLTTNAGSEIYKSISQYASDDSGSGAMMKHYMKLIQESITTTTGANRFPPELLGRIDCLVPFQPLSEATLTKIVQKKLMDLMRMVYAVHGVRLKLEQNVISYIVKDNLDTGSDSGGARKAASKIESDVTAPVAAYINMHPDHKTLLVKVEGKMAFQDKSMLESRARIVVRPIAG